MVGQKVSHPYSLLQMFAFLLWARCIYTGEGYYAQLPPPTRTENVLKAFQKA